MTLAASSAQLTGIKQTPKSLPISVDSPERSAAGLPPRPMVVKREVSKQLKKKRKKKKKKKKQVLALVRICSRENIDEMPIISESESECDSEYTSGDEEFLTDESSYDASTGCLTPSRLSARRASIGASSGTSSRASSRASSPQKSPRDDFFPPGSTDSPDYEFVMEAPEFSEDLFAKMDKKQVIGVDENLPPNLALRPRARSKSDEVKQLAVDPGKARRDELSSKSKIERRSFEIPTENKSKHPSFEIPTANKSKRPSFEIPNKNKRECFSLEIDSATDLNSSFAEENGTVMERMLPLPWLATSRNKRMN